MSSLKISKVDFNNRKKELTIVYKNKKIVTLHYGQLGLKKNILSARIDPESKGLALALGFQDGKKEYIPYDIPLILSQDPDYLFQTEIEELIADIKIKMQDKKISKKYLARQLQTSDIQIERLLNPKTSKKNFQQLNKIAHILGMNLSIKMEEAA